jgi:hypothetical protein
MDRGTYIYSDFCGGCYEYKKIVVINGQGLCEECWDGEEDIEFHNRGWGDSEARKIYEEADSRDWHGTDGMERQEWSLY